MTKFDAIDTETTGLSKYKDRILELTIIDVTRIVNATPC